MGLSYVEFNAPDVEGSIPGSFPLIKQKHSHLVNICDPVDGSSIFQTNVSFVAAHILNLSDTASLRIFCAT